MKYSEALQYLFRTHQKHGIKLSLERMRKLSLKLGNPEKNFKSIHIAGTNGKGSTTTKIAEGLLLSGYKVGLFTSPHINTFKERIQINNAFIPEEAVCFFLQKIQKVEEELNLFATFFELTTLLAFLYFANEDIDWAAIETGLGGRLDATNILLPELSIITSIGFDHMEILGYSLEAIALEKAGIIKNNIPILIGPRVPFETIRTVVEHTQSEIFRVEGNFSTFDMENSSIAKKALEYLEIDPLSIEKAIQKRPPCRIEIFKNPFSSFPVILDVAHNPDGFIKLFESLDILFPKMQFSIVLGLSQSKDIASCLKIAAEKAKSIYLVKASSPRAASLSSLREELEAIGYQNFQTAPSIKQALSLIDQPAIIAGTFFIMREAREALGLEELADPIDLNEPSGIVREKESFP